MSEHTLPSASSKISPSSSKEIFEVQKSLHQDIPPQDFEKHQKSETASVETRVDDQKLSSDSNAFPEDQNTECNWSEHTCHDGNKYYFNCDTWESTWEKPEEYSMYERWFEEQTSLKDQQLVSPPFKDQTTVSKQKQSDRPLKVYVRKRVRSKPADMPSGSESAK